VSLLEKLVLFLVIEHFLLTLRSLWIERKRDKQEKRYLKNQTDWHGLVEKLTDGHKTLAKAMAIAQNSWDKLAKLDEEKTAAMKRIADMANSPTETNRRDE